MTDDQIEYELETALKKIQILEHALGDKTHYRNYYVGSPEHKDWKMLKELEQAGYMEQDFLPHPANDYFCLFRVTEKGKTLAFCGERLNKS